MDDAAVRLADQAESEAYAAMCAAAPPEFAAAVGLEALTVGGAGLVVAPGLPITLFNRAAGLGNDGPVRDEDIVAIAEVYRSRGVRAWWMQVGPLGLRQGADEQLLRLGFTRPERRAWAKVMRRPAPVEVPPCPFDIRAVAPEERMAVAGAIAAGFSMPPALAPWLAAIMAAPGWQAYAAFDGERVAGGGMLYLKRKVAWLGVGSVAPEFRRRGAQRALMATRIYAAFEAGAAWIVSETGEPVDDEPNPSLRNMYACGFEKVCSRENFAAPV